MKKMLKRLFLCFVLIAALTAGYAFWIEPSRLVVKELSLSTDKFTGQYRVLFFTDTHFGRYYSTEKARALAQLIDRQKPDLVIFGGDLFDNYTRDRQLLDTEELRDAFASIEAPFGKYAVFGNHDYGGGAERIYRSFFESCGFQVLQNETAAPAGLPFSITGYDDALLGRADPEGYALSGEGFRLVISHEPARVNSVSGNAPFFMLSGHTHGGQVSLPILTELVLPPGSGAFRKGLYTFAGEERGLFVSSGIGTTGLPIRLFNTPEVICIDLVGNGMG